MNTQNPAMQNRQAKGERTALIIDDNEDVALALGTCLRNWGFSVSYARDGYAATVEARKQRFDVILLDFMLPAGDGGLVYERLKSNDAAADVPVIFVSAMPEYQLREHLLQIPEARLVPKPIDWRLLSAYMTEIFSAKAPQAESRGAAAASR